METNQLPSTAWEIIHSADGDGLKPRDLFLRETRELFGIDEDVDDLLARYHVDYPACYTVDQETTDAVRRLRTGGWMVGVFTNGPPSQREKLEATNLVDDFDAICISAVVGSWEPDRLIFEEAARICGLPLAGWMIGDSPSADIGGGKQAGLQTIWMARGRTWDSSEFGPDAIVHIIPEAVEIILQSDLR